MGSYCRFKLIIVVLNFAVHPKKIIKEQFPMSMPSNSVIKVKVYYGHEAALTQCFTCNIPAQIK